MNEEFINNLDLGAAVEPQIPQAGNQPTNVEPQVDTTTKSDTSDINKPIGGTNEAPPVEKETVAIEKVAIEPTIAVGTEVETPDGVFTVAANGDLVDDKGKVFKTAAEVDEYVKSFDDGSPIDYVSEIATMTGYELVDANGQVIKYDNTVEGLAQYTKDVVKVATEDAKAAAFDEICTTYPVLSKVINYVIANGGSIDGFGNIKDRTGVVIDPNNTDQQKDIIRQQWKEAGTAGDVEDYIGYLEHSGRLLTSADAALDLLKKRDQEELIKIKQEAERNELERVTQVQNYYKALKETVLKGEVGEYKIPDNIIVTKNGQKKNYTRNDFYEYISAPIDQKGTTRYQLDLQKDDYKNQINDDVLRAYLKFTGGSFAGLVEKAVREQEVKRLVLAKKSISTRKANIGSDNGKVSFDDLLLS